METVIITSLGALCLWLGWRLVTLRRGIENLTKTLQESPSNRVDESPPGISEARLAELSSATIESVTESGQTRDIEIRHRQFLEAVLDEIKDAIFIVSRDHEIRFLNEAARQLFPSNQNYITRPLLEICRDHRIFDTIELAEEVGAKISDQIDLRVQTEDPGRLREIQLLVEAEPLSIEANEASNGSWILMRDITSQLETEQIRQDFVANASHELRTPLSIINGYLETMDEEKDSETSPANRRAIRTMRKHGNRISRIVDDMLTISKLEDTKDLLNREPFDLVDSVNDMIDQLIPIIEDSHASVRVEHDSRESWILLGDRYYWDQIFFNLIENALKQNQEAGLNITIRFRCENHRYLISVEDDGIGIPNSDIGLIFKRFYRVQKHHAQGKVKGTGLGLSIVKRAVEAHHGDISVESRPGTRTTFTISVAESTPLGSGETSPGKSDP